MAVPEIEIEESRQRPVRVNGRYWRGVFTGIFSVIFLVTAAGYYVLNGRGLSIFIDREKLASAVRAKVRARADQEIPLVVAKIVRDATAQLLAGSEGPRLTVQIGQRRMELPVETMAFLRDQFRGAAEESLQATLAKFDPGPYANELAEEAYRMVQQVLAEEVYGKTFRFYANRWLSVPVTVQGGAQ